MALSHPFGMQLYSARKFPPVAMQFAAIKDAGFTHVEPFGPFYEAVNATAQLLRSSGLAALSGHFGLDMAERTPDRVAEIAAALGIEIVVIPYLTPGERPSDAAGWAALGRRLEAIRLGLDAKGLRVAWHNHDFEFAVLPDGSRPIEHLLGTEFLWEADLAWIVKGGGDPAYWLDHYRGRIPLVHVKDIAPPGQKADEDGWADVGAGILPWPDLWQRAIAAGAEAMIAEHDNPSSFSRFATASAAAMRGFNAGSAS